MHNASARHDFNNETLTEDEPLLRAAFIYNFSKFTHWPENSIKFQDNSLFLCISGKDELVYALKQLENKKIKGRPVVIHSLKNEQDSVNCHVLYIASSEKKHYTNILKTIHGKPVLTISSIRKFSHSGGIIELFREKGKTRFIINLDVARQSGLLISSRLLILADVIVDEEIK